MIVLDTTLKTARRAMTVVHSDPDHEFFLRKTCYLKLTIALGGHSVCKGSVDFIPNVRKPNCEVSGELRLDDLGVKVIVMYFGRTKNNVGMQRLRSRHKVNGKL